MKSTIKRTQKLIIEKDNIVHNTLFDVKKVATFYAEKDNTEITYVCTSSVSEHGAQAADIFYRNTPHPEFGNKYFGIYTSVDGETMITNADNIENLTFSMILKKGKYHYSQHRHDFRNIGDVSIDGGRSYFRRIGNLGDPRQDFKVENGAFVKIV